MTIRALRRAGADVMVTQPLDTSALIPQGGAPAQGGASGGASAVARAASGVLHEIGAAALCEADAVVVCVDMSGLAAVAREDAEVARRFAGTPMQVKHAAWRSLQCAQELLAMLGALRRTCKRPLTRLPTLLVWHSPSSAVRVRSRASHAQMQVQTGGGGGGGASAGADSGDDDLMCCSYSELLTQLSDTYEVDALLQVGGWASRSDGSALYAGAGASAALCVGALLGQWRRVLVVDDSPFNVRLVARFLFQFPAVALTASMHGRHCLMLAMERGARRQPARLLYTDLNMPGMAGHELADRIRALPFEGADEVKVVAITGSTTVEDKRRMEKHMESFLAKPIAIEQVQALLDSYVPLRPLSMTE